LLFMVIIGAQLLIIIVVGSLMIRTIPSSPHFLQHFMARTAIGQAGGFEMDKNVTMDWHKLSNRMEHLNMNPVYASLGIPRKIVRPVVNLLLIVSSAPSRIERRMAIRDTWWNQSTTNDKVVVKCVFMTDKVDPTTEIGQKVAQENEKYKDMAFQNLRGGVEFGKRFLYHMIWALQNYEFDYFMRMDDDYFLCLERFIKELPMPRRSMYHWGFVHCVPSIVRPEESIILFSRDLHERLLDQDPALIKSHPWADQMVATWIKELNIQNIYNHDPRLHHHPVLKFINNVDVKFKDVCKNFIGVHGSYPKYQRSLWKLRNGVEYAGKGLDGYTNKCNHPQVFVWSVFGGVWRYEPKKFIDNPTWDTQKQGGGNQAYGGREDGRNR